MACHSARRQPTARAGDTLLDLAQHRHRQNAGWAVLLDEGNESPGRECRVVLGFEMWSGVVYHGAMIGWISVDGNHSSRVGKGALARPGRPFRPSPAG
jgi:hypothetical protein